MTHKNRKKVHKFHKFHAVCSLLRAEGFSCSLDVLYKGLGISKLQFFLSKNGKNSIVFFSSIFGHQNPGSGTGFNESGSEALQESHSLFLQRGEGEADRREGGPTALPR